MLPNKLQNHVFGELKSKLQPRPTDQKIPNVALFFIYIYFRKKTLSELVWQVKYKKTINVLIKKDFGRVFHGKMYLDVLVKFFFFLFSISVLINNV